MQGESRAKPVRAETKGEVVIIGRSAAICRIREIIRTAAASDASVLIEGESGTGKELIARAIHVGGKAASGAFVSINCAAIPHELIEPEFFGYKRGAFTGASQSRQGLIEAASGGTLFLDEIGEMPRTLQAKLLRVLQERSLRRLGEVEEIKVDFRLICATNRDVSQSIRLGALREDLFYRISTIRIKVPPLRERLDDLPLIVEHLVKLYSLKYRKSITSISVEALRAMKGYSWPGNVRELENTVERAILYCRGEQITSENLPEDLRTTPPAGPLSTSDMSLRDIERYAITAALERNGGNITKCAGVLGVSRQTLYRKLKALNLDPRKSRRRRPLG